MTLVNYGYLSEGYGKNLCQRGLYPSNTSPWSDWFGDLTTGAVSGVTNPDGTSTITHFGATDTSSAFHRYLQDYTATANVNQTITAYIHAAEEEWVQIFVGDSTHTVWTVGSWFNVGTGAVGSPRDIGVGVLLSADIEQVTAADSTTYAWYRCRITITPKTGDTAFRLAICAANADNVTTYAASSAGDGHYVYGVQIEENDFATSLIPTPTAATAERFADSNEEYLGTLNTPISIAMEIRTGGGDTGTQVFYQADDDTAGIGNSIRIARESGVMHVRVEPGGSPSVDLNLGALADNTSAQIAVVLADNNFQATIDQDNLQTDVSDVGPTGITNGRIGHDHTPANWAYGHITSLGVWPSLETDILTQFPGIAPEDSGRALSALLLAETLSDQLSPIMMVELEFSGGTVNFWTGFGDLTWDSKAWTGTGYFGGVSSVEETTETKATGVRFTLSSIPSSVLAIALNEQYQGRAARLYIGALDSANKLIADPYLTFTGKMDTMDLNEGGDNSTITLTAENELIDLERVREFRYTPEDQKIYFPGDTFFDYVSPLQDAQLIWGGEKDGTRLTPAG